jgi:hypothetical protein
VASSVVNVAPPVGGSVGIAALGTVAWTTAAHQIHSLRAGGAAATVRHALATGFDRAFLVAAGVALAILILAVVLIRERATGAADQALPVAKSDRKDMTSLTDGADREPRDCRALPTLIPIDW